MSEAVVTQMEAALKRMAEDDRDFVLELVAALYTIARQVERVANELTAVSYRPGDA